MFVAIVVCIAASGYLYRELMKTREEVKSYRNFTSQVAQRMSRPVHFIQERAEPVTETETETPVEEEPSTPEPVCIKEPETPRKPGRKVKFTAEE